MFDTTKTVPDDNFYLLCRNRDICLRMMSENPIEYADATVTPCVVFKSANLKTQKRLL